MVSKADILDFGFDCGFGGSIATNDLRDSSFHFVPFGMTRQFKKRCKISDGCAAADFIPFPPVSVVISTERRNLLFHSQIVIDSSSLLTITTSTSCTMGNITFKTDAGNFAYGNPNRPFQITEQTNMPADYDEDLLTATTVGMFIPMGAMAALSIDGYVFAGQYFIDMVNWINTT